MYTQYLLVEVQYKDVASVNEPKTETKHLLFYTDKYKIYIQMKYVINSAIIYFLKTLKTVFLKRKERNLFQCLISHLYIATNMSTAQTALDPPINHCSKSH